MRKPNLRISLRQYLSERIQNHPEIIYLALIILGGWLIRIILAVNTGGMVHPDEIYQSLEIAHKLKYGYGYVPWEFKLPTSPNQDGAARSYLFPLLFYIIFELCDLGGIPYGIDGTLLVVRIFSATYSTLLIPIVFYLSKEILPSQEKPYIPSLFGAFLTAVWFHFPYYGIRTITNSFVCVPIFFAIYLHLISNKYEFSPVKTIGLELTAGSLLGFACVLRPDSIVFFAPFFLLRLQTRRRSVYLYILMFFGFLGSLIVQGLSDLVYYGEFFISPINWFRFNIIEGKSSLYGTAPISYYVESILAHEFYVIFFSLMLCILIAKIWWALHRNKGKFNDIWFFAILELLIWFLFSLGIMSLVEHKEERFIYSLYPIAVFIFVATLKECFDILETAYDYFHSIILPKINIKRVKSKKEVMRVQMVLFLIFCIFTSQMSIISSTKTDWAFFHDVNKALEWVGNQENSTGVIIFSHWFYTGGWTYLHKNISMQFFNNPQANFYWMYLPPSYNYLVTPHYQYELYSNLEANINTTFILLKTIDGSADIWHLNSSKFVRARKSPLSFISNWTSPLNSSSLSLALVCNSVSQEQII